MAAVKGHCIRKAGKADLAAVNHVIESAVMSWQLPERVKRLSLPSYYYDAADLLHLDLWAVDDSSAGIIAVVGWEEADTGDMPLMDTNKLPPKAWKPAALNVNARGLLLHGIYVLPAHHGKGLGRQLLHRAEQYAADKSYSGVLVKAQADSIGFFQHMGYERLPVEDHIRHYSHRLWKATAIG